MKITFDPIKSKTNRLKHRVDLSDVEGVFYDDHSITFEDKDHTEERFVTLGIDGFGRLLVVSYHYRNEAFALFQHVLPSLTSGVLTKRIKK